MASRQLLFPRTNTQDTTLNLNLGMREELAVVQDHAFESVLIRPEYTIRRAGAELSHERARSALQSMLDDVSHAFFGKEKWYRFSDYTASEANALRGVHEQMEDPNPLLGLRGVRRLIANPPLLEHELDVIMPYAETDPQFNVLLPMVHEPEQVIQIKRALESRGYKNKLGVMMEIPSAFLLLGQISPLADHFIIGLNDLACFLLGTDRDSSSYSRVPPSVRRFLDAYLTKRRDNWEMAGYLGNDEISLAKSFGIKGVYVRAHELPEILREVLA